MQHRGRNFSFRLKARAFWANNFHPLCHSATPTAAPTLPIDMLCDPPRRSIVEAQQPLSLHPLVSNRGESCSSPARCVPCRFPATTTRNSRTGRHGQDWPCNLYVAMPGIGLTTPRIQRHCRAKWRGFMPLQNQGSIRDASDLSISRGHDIGQCGDRMPNRQTPITPPTSSSYPTARSVGSLVQSASAYYPSYIWRCRVRFQEAACIGCVPVLRHSPMLTPLVCLPTQLPGFIFRP